MDSCKAIVIGTRRGELYLVGCQLGNATVFAVGPLEKPRQHLLLGKTYETQCSVAVMLVLLLLSSSLVL